jgi:hypothetical protein
MKVRTNKKNYKQKIALAAGSLSALALQVPESDAAVVHVTGSPVTMNLNAANGSEETWDVDGDSVRDFFLKKFDNPGSYGGGNERIHLSSLSANGEGFVNAAGNPNGADIQRLNTGFAVGPTLAAGYFFGTSTTSRRVLSGTAYPVAFFGPNPQGFSSGQDGFTGFAFETGGDTHYGWATLNIDLTLPGTVTISQWAYETSPNTAIAVGAVPEPSSLALLALGAGGVAAWRLRKKRKNTSDDGGVKREES